LHWLCNIPEASTLAHCQQQYFPQHRSVAPP
jgi:hypothetical protein